MPCLRRDRRTLRSVFFCTLLISCLTLAGGCAHTYFCDNGKTIEAREQMGGERVVIDVDEGAFTLNRVPADSGKKYSDGRRTFWFRGNELTAEIGGTTPYGRCVMPSK